MKIVFITGVSGTMGSEALKQIAQTGTFRCRVLLRPKKANIKLAKKLQKNEAFKVFGDIYFQPRFLYHMHIVQNSKAGLIQ